MKKSTKKEQNIENFLNEEKLFVFVRQYTLTNALAIYHSYRHTLEKETGCRVYKNILVYKNTKGFYKFFLVLDKSNLCLTRKINSKTNSRFLMEKIDEYYKNIDKFRKNIASIEQTPKQIFNLASKILAIEAISFLTPNIAAKNKNLTKKCKEARIKTEKLFAPGGEMDSFLGKLNYLPSYIKRKKLTTKKGFILFNNDIITDKKILDKFKEKKKKQIKIQEIKGFTGYKGKVKGMARIILSPKHFSKMNKGDILVTHGTTTDYVPVIKLCSAIISDEGGILCHAVIVARELKIPCIVGTKIATQTLKNGDYIEVDANKGLIKILKK
jgi:phosphoenolpyruvate synthase/pyruvate phosphate dikinase